MTRKFIVNSNANVLYNSNRMLKNYKNVILSPF